MRCARHQQVWPRSEVDASIAFHESTISSAPESSCSSCACVQRLRALPKCGHPVPYHEIQSGSSRGASCPPGLQFASVV